MRLNKGYIFAVLAVVLYSISDAIAKYYVRSYGFSNVMFVCSLARFAPFVVIAFFKRINPYRTNNLIGNVLRALCASCCAYAFLAAYKFSPMTDVLVVSQSAAIIVIPLSVIFLNERFNPYTVTSIFLGFMGIICAFRPSGNVFQFGMVFALIAAIGGALNRILCKKLSLADSELTLIFYHQTLVLILAIVGGFDCKMPIEVVMILVLGGLTSGTALYTTLRAYKFAECTHIASAAYLILIPATIIDCVVYNKVPDLYIIAGSILIILGCVIANYPDIISKEKHKNC